MTRDEEIRSALGEVIRDTRRSRGLTLKGLAGLADLDWSQLSKIERADSGVSPATLERIGHELGFTLPALYAAALARRPTRPSAKSKPRRRGRRAMPRSAAARLVRAVHEESIPHPKP